MVVVLVATTTTKVVKACLHLLERPALDSLEMFAKPQDVANRIAMKLGVDLVRKAQPLFDEKAFEDTPQAWGDDDDSNDDRLRDDKPPHWG